MTQAKRKKKLTATGDYDEREKNIFLDIISHHLRTPIAGVRWSLDALKNGRLGKLNKEQREAVTAAYQHNLYLAKVVNDMLRVRWLDERGASLHPAMIAVSSVVRSVVDRYKPFVAAHNGNVTIKELQSVKAYVDLDKFEWVIAALVHNAVSYSRSACSVAITVKRRGEWAVISIRDQGIGIPRREISRVFSKFFRAANARQIHPEGLGLDLYVAHQFIEASGGSMAVHSKEKGYTEFVVLLPTSRVAEAKKKPTIATDEMLRKERQFVAVTVHELREPLATTKWSLDTLKTGRPGPLTPEQRKLVDQIYAGNNRLLVLVGDMLNLAKLQEGSFGVMRKPFKIEKIISDAIRGTSDIADANNIKIASTQKALPSVSGDSVRLSQVITNLLSNAIKYSKHGGVVKISAIKVSGASLRQTADKSGVSIINYNHKAGYVLVSVSDKGIGMTKADYQRVFTPFFRSKSALSSGTDGTGLGLYISKSIIDMHKGDMWFESSLGRGSTFYFSVPVASGA